MYIGELNQDFTNYDVSTTVCPYFSQNKEKLNALKN